MRIALFCLVGLLVGGCSSNQVTLTMRDGAKIESELLSVRDSSIIIQEKGGAPIVIRNEDVDNVMRVAGSPVPSIVGFGSFGAIVGFGIGFFFNTTECLEDVCTDSHPGALSGTLIGAGVGTIIGALSAPKDKTFYLPFKYDREALKDYSKYYDTEPDELKKIK